MSDLVQLRPVSTDDLPIFFEQQLDPEATRMADFPARDREAFMTHWNTRVLHNDSVIVKTILHDTQVAGNIVSWEQEGRWLIGYWLGREFWGKGIATQALHQFVQLMTVRPLYAYVAQHNVASQRVLAKCGFTIVIEDQSVGQTAAEFLLKLA